MADLPERWRTDLTAQTVWSSEGGPMICQTCEPMAYPPERAKALARRIATLPDVERQRDLLLELVKRDRGTFTLFGMLPVDLHDAAIAECEGKQ